MIRNLELNPFTSRGFFHGLYTGGNRVVHGGNRLVHGDNRVVHGGNRELFNAM